MKVSSDACLFGAWTARQLSFPESPSRILDIGTGTGLLALMLAQASPILSIDAVELDPAAARQAAANIAGSDFHEQIKVFQDDIRQFRTEKPYDFIISNPPFYQNELKSNQSQKNIAHHDEGLLLDELLTVIGQLLAEEGRFYLLWPYKRMEEILQKIKWQGWPITRIVKVKQTTAHSPFRLMLEGRKGIAADESVTTEMAVKTTDDQYTEEFRELLKEYYMIF